MKLVFRNMQKAFKKKKVTCARIRIFSSFSTKTVPTSRCMTSLRRFPSNLQSSSKLWKDISSAMSSVVSVMIHSTKRSKVVVVANKRRMRHVMLYSGKTIINNWHPSRGRRDRCEIVTAPLLLDECNKLFKLKTIFVHVSKFIKKYLFT